jgi:hypothetical protein
MSGGLNLDTHELLDYAAWRERVNEIKAAPDRDKESIGQEGDEDVCLDVLEQQQPKHEAGLDPRPPLVAVERRDLAIEPIPVDLAPPARASC